MDIQPDDEDIEGEIAISFSPRFEELGKLGITPEQFESALLVALEEFETLSAQEDFDAGELSLEEMTLHVGGTAYRLGDLADIEIGDAEEEEFEEEED